MKNEKLRFTVVFAALAVLAIAALAAGLTVGSSELTAAEAVNGIFHGGGLEGDIMWKIRIPRAMAAMLLGGALALSGYLLQTFFHNPIAGPFVLGISSGAKLVVALTMIAAARTVGRLGSISLILAAFAGAMLSLCMILPVSQRVSSGAMLVVCGVMTGYICSAVTDLAVTFADDADIVNLRDWSMGTFSGMKTESLGVIAAVTLGGGLCTFLLSKPLGAYRLGEDFAAGVGVRVKLLRAAIILLSGLLSACVTAFAGPISFVGIAAPHIVGVLLGTSKPIALIPACFLCGGIFCSFCDIAARTVFAPTELSISSVTAVFGAPVVIAVMLRKRRGEP